jgi:hypothetical protein
LSQVNEFISFPLLMSPPTKSISPNEIFCLIKKLPAR